MRSSEENLHVIRNFLREHGIAGGATTNSDYTGAASGSEAVYL